MRRFSSYGPVDKYENYYVPGKELIEYALKQFLGEYPKTGVKVAPIFVETGN